ncbi:hypothetical protein BDZ89DRAFT_1170342 [Hymenopellis radicata]|nr:hypothetical protein BDZ89DRAFT_1170342 [Hymenopellis radicata]
MPEKHTLSDSGEESPSPSPRKAKRIRLARISQSSSTKPTFKFPMPSTPRRIPLPSSSPIKGGYSQSSSSSVYSQALSLPPPTDSPNNPFGRISTVTLRSSLPKPTGYGFHLLLRCQFFRKSTPKGEGTYRIVQLPNGYTFAHLRHLLAFIYGGDEDGSSHLFEVRRQVTMCKPVYKLGAVKKGTGEPWVRIACGGQGDPWVWTQSGFSTDSDSDDVEVENPKIDAWRYEPEDTFTLKHLWPDAHHPDTSLAIIYHHRPSDVQIHISIFDPRKKLPDGTLSLEGIEAFQRKGFGNDPYVFRARGRVFLASSKRKHDEPTRDMCSDEDRGEWNARGAFEAYLREHAEPMQDWEEDDEEDELDAFGTPSLTWSSSPSSSPFKSISSSVVRPFPTTLFPHAASSPMLPTPAPLPGARKRLEYVRKRIRQDSLKQERNAEEKAARRKAKLLKKQRQMEQRRKEVEEKERPIREAQERRRMRLLHKETRLLAAFYDDDEVDELDAPDTPSIEVIDVDALESEEEEKQQRVYRAMSVEV